MMFRTEPLASALPMPTLILNRSATVPLFRLAVPTCVAPTDMSDAEMLKHLQDNIVPATRSLNGEFLELDSKRGFSRCRFKILLH